MFYTYNQNNSGGKFDFDVESGTTHFVIIEADTEQEADKYHLLNIGDSGSCPCCGDRWNGADYEGGKEVPTIYGDEAKNYDGRKWMESGREICIHYKNGRKEWF